jgi:hypothetical protein
VQIEFQSIDAKKEIGRNSIKGFLQNSLQLRPAKD